MNSHADTPQEQTAGIPEAYRPVRQPSNFNNLCGPYFEKIENGVNTAMAVRMEEKHLNQRDITHGGMLMALADNAMGDAAARAYQYKAGLVTVSMNSDFLKPAAVGDWVEARPVILRKGKRMAFAECPLYVNNTLIFRASGVFAVVERRD